MLKKLINNWVDLIVDVHSTDLGKSLYTNSEESFEHLGYILLDCEKLNWIEMRKTELIWTERNWTELKISLEIRP